MNVMPPLHRIDLAREATFNLGTAEVRPAQREILSGAQREVLEPRIMQVLTLLAKRRGEVVTRDDLISTCWENRAVGDDAIVRCIGRIRRLAETYGGFSLETIPRVGYRLTETAPAIAAPPVAADAVKTPDPPAKASAAKFWGWMFAVAGVLVAAGLAAALLLLHSPEKFIVVQAPSRQTIAVLPFSPLTADPEVKMFGDAIAAAAAETLSKVGEPVVSPAESFQYRGSAKARAAAALKAIYIVDGVILKDGDKLRVSVRFDDGIHGRTIFAHTFEERADRAAALTERVAAYVAAVSWGSDITHWDPRTAPEILRGFEQQERGDLYAAYETARQLAVRKPDDGDIQRVYASAIMNLFYAIPEKHKLWLLEEGRHAAERAIALSPEQGEAYSALASATPHYLWAEREQYLRRALAAKPDSIGVAEYLVWLLNDAGRFREAEPFARNAYERFPYHAQAFQRWIEQALGAGHAEAAQPALEQARRLWPESSLFLNLTLEAAAFSGHPDDRILKNAELVERLSPQRLALWTDVFKALQSRKASDIDALSGDCAVPGDNWPICLMAYSALGKIDEAFKLSDSAYPDQRAPSRAALMDKWLANPELPSTRYLFLPVTAPLRADPRFAPLMERVGLAAYWRNHPPDFCASERVTVCRR